MRMRVDWLALSALIAFVPQAAHAEDQAATAKVITKRPVALAEARNRLMHGNYEEAREAYENAAKKDATLAPAAAIGISETHRLVGDYDKAVATLDAVKKTNPDDADLLAASADLLFELGRWDEADVDADAAIKKNDGQLLARFTRARILRDRGKFTEADQAFRWVVRYYTKRSNDDNDIIDAEELALVAQCGAENARWHNLSRQFSFILNEVIADSLKNDKNFWPVELLAGQMLLEKYNRPDAIDAFDKALKINPKAAAALVGKGEAALVAYELREAEGFADRALQHNPHLPSALRLKADLSTVAGDFTDAEKHLAAALKVNGRDTATLGRLAAIYLMTKRHAEFDAVLKSVQSFDARPGLFYHELATVLDERKQYARAESCFKKAAELRPELAGPRTGLGMLKLRMGDEVEGRKLLDAAFKADPFNVRVANSRKVLDHLAAYQTVRTAHYDLRFDPATDRVLALFLAEYLEETHQELKKQFGFEPPGRTLIEVFNSHQMFSGRIVGLPDLHTIGACTGKVVAMASPTAKGLARPFNWGRVIRHELTHIFNLAQTDFLCPHWLTEGLAVGNEKGERPLLWSRILRDRAVSGELLTLDTITLGFVKPRREDERTLAYTQSQIYTDYLVATYGAPAVAKLLEAYRADANTAAVLKSALNVDQATFEAGYRKYLDGVVAKLRTGVVAAIQEKAMTFEELTASAAKSPDDLSLKVRLSEGHLRRNQTTEAKKLSDEVLTKDARNTRALVVRARLLQRGGDEAGAKTALLAALDTAPDDPRLLFQVGKMHIDAKEFNEASKVLEHGRKIAPLDGGWLEPLAKLYATTRQPEKQIAVLREWVGQDPDELDGRVKLSQLLLDSDRPAEAEPIAKDALMIDVSNAPARQVLLDALRAQKKQAEAEKYEKRFAE